MSENLEYSGSDGLFSRLMLACAAILWGISITLLFMAAVEATFCTVNYGSGNSYGCVILGATHSGAVFVAALFTFMLPVLPAILVLCCIGISKISRRPKREKNVFFIIVGVGALICPFSSLTAFSLIAAIVAVGSAQLVVKAFVMISLMRKKKVSK